MFPVILFFSAKTDIKKNYEFDMIFFYVILPYDSKAFKEISL